MKVQLLTLCRVTLMVFYGFSVLICCARPLSAQEKLVILDDVPRNLNKFEVKPDGSAIIFAASEYQLFSSDGKVVGKFSAPHSSTPRDLMPLPDGWYISCNSYNKGHIGLVRPDGTTARTLVGKGGNERVLRSDMTEWGSPTGAAIDIEKKLIFVLDVSKAEKGKADPWWSRIAVFDFEGKYLRDINRFSGAAAAGLPENNDDRRTTYSDIEVDPARQRVYVTAARTNNLLVFSYDGEAISAFPGSGGIAVFADGRIATNVGRDIVIYSPELHEVQRLKDMAASDMESDDAGRLYASYANSPAILFRRWAPDLKTSEILSPQYRNIKLNYPSGALTAGATCNFKVEISGNPAPQNPDSWQVLARPSDGSDLRWQRWSGAYAEGTLQVSLPETVHGIYEVVVRHGQSGYIDRVDRASDLFVQRTVAIMPVGATQSVSIFPSSGRRVFQQGEVIAISLVRRSADAAVVAAPVSVHLQQGETILSTLTVDFASTYHAQIPASITRRLAPGNYQLRPQADGYASYALSLDIVQQLADSPMQRILYHEFGGEAVNGMASLLDPAERLDFLQAYALQVAAMGFTRETERMVGKITLPTAWKRDAVPTTVAAPSFAVPEYYNVPGNSANWAMDYYSEQMVKHGIVFDSTLLPHCGGVRFRDEVLFPLNAQLQRFTQWMMRYPSFYGFNYNDELFFGGWANPWAKEDSDWLRAFREEKFQGRPDAESKLAAFDIMYNSFNSAVRRVKPDIKSTHAPMWQYPAQQGSYPPSIYKDMSESYSHYLSEGYHVPWYSPHSAEILRRPGLPLMGVVDNQYSSRDGEVYAKNAMQVLARGVQGVGVQHTASFGTGLGTVNYRLTNEIARLYGPVFAECTPLNDGAILYSFTQDVSERVHTFGTPHWQRVYEVYGAMQMAGIPMSITFEEDIAAGWLLQGAKPRVPLLVLLGQEKALPQAVSQQISRFMQAGGKVVIDADSADYPGALKLTMHTHQLADAWKGGVDADTWHPLMQPILEGMARDLKTALGQFRTFPVDSSDPWVAPNGFDGGAVRYLMLVSETTPFPFDAGGTWSVGAMYAKGKNLHRPKKVTVTLPAGQDIMYDLFNQQRIRPAVAGQHRSISVDMSAYPAQLYALVPAPLGAPALRYNVQGDMLNYQVQIVDEQGKALAARVPLRLRLRQGAEVAQEIIRGTDNQGIYSGEMALPLQTGAWSVEVTELLSGLQSSAAVTGEALRIPLFSERPAVEIDREDRIRLLLADAKAQGGITLVMGRNNILSADGQQGLQQAFLASGIPMTVAPLAPAAATPGIYLAIGYVKDAGTQGELLTRAINAGLFGQAISVNTPGGSRAVISAIFAPRDFREDAIAILAGDESGLELGVTRFIGMLAGKADAAEKRNAQAAIPFNQTGVANAGRATDLLKMQTQIGAQLAGILASPDGKRLLVTSDGYMRNAALLEDTGAEARLIRTERIGQGPSISSAFLSKDGQLFGASGRVTERYGQAMFLVDAANGARQAFAGFGDLSRMSQQHAVSDDGNTVVVGGLYGVVCWKRAAQVWREAWSVDYYKEFPKLDWPVHALNERAPQFHAFIPAGADYVLVLFTETTENGWVTPDNFYGASLSAYKLADGKRDWLFEVPIPNTFLMPSLFRSDDGKNLLLQVRMGGWNKKSYRFYTLRDGAQVAEWNSAEEPGTLAVGNGAGHVANAYENRALESRTQSGELRFSLLWPAQPLHLAFGVDGETLFVVDDAGTVSRVDAEGNTVWRIPIPAASRVTTTPDRLYIAAWSGQVSAYTLDGKLVWMTNLTKALSSDDSMQVLANAGKLPDGSLFSVSRPSTTSTHVPAGDNMLAGAAAGKFKITDSAGTVREVQGVGNDRAVLSVGGTPGWKSSGKVQVKAEDLVNGDVNDVDIPWLHLNEVFWSATAGRQVWAEISFVQPIDVNSLTVYENPNYAESWPTDAVVQVWNEELQRWDTAAYGIFLQGAINNYALNLKAVTKIRYVPWNNYFRNFHTSEIEVR